MRRTFCGILLLSVFCFAALAPAVTFTVSNTSDSGGGSLRQAILDANNQANSAAPDTIAFAIPGSGVQTISPTTGLPTIADPVIIDGYTQPGASANTLPNGNNAVLLIELSGNLLPPNSTGLFITAGTSIVRGLVINRFDNSGTLGGFGIFLDTGDSNVVEGNFIGTDPTGTVDRGNGNDGIFIFNDSRFNTIGGTTPAARNLISGNDRMGILIFGSSVSNNVVQGNFIGTNAAGTGALGNSDEGIIVENSADNTIGGTASGARNIISSNGNVNNDDDGISIYGAEATRNLVQGNFIGIDVTGTQALANATEGVSVGQDASNNTIGGADPGARNLISGNNGAGVAIYDGGSLNRVEGNYIGTDVTGAAGLGNGSEGISVGDGSSNNTIGGTAPGAGNVISANAEDGLAIYDGGSSNKVQGNFIGTDATGMARLGNGSDGVTVGTDCNNNVIGGTLTGARNIISANGEVGVVFYGGASLNKVEGNYIGTDANGTADLGNLEDGVGIFGSANNTIGGTASAARNVIAGNGDDGVVIADQGATGNAVQGNFIGVDVSGTVALANAAEGVTIADASGNTIGVPGAGNVISGNGRSGVEIIVENSGASASNNVVRGNFIGTDVTGTAALANAEDGVQIEEAANNLIGGTDADSGNVISGNGDDGVLVFGIGAADNQISQNLIGRNAANDGALGNGGHGVLLLNSGPNIVGGGFNPDNANTIAHNGAAGVAVVFAANASIRKGILENSIFDNGGLGIDLEDDGVTANDLGDADLGANTLQNFPVLTSASVGAGGTTIEGTLNSTANTNFRIEFFSNERADPSLYGEGQTFLGATVDLTSDADGNLAFNVVLNVTPPAGQTLITATATDSDNNNTSEFSQAIRLAGTNGRLLNIATRLRVQTGENVLIGGLIITGTEPKRVMIRGIGPSLAQFFSGALTNPTLELFQGSTLLQSNDDWRTAQEQEIQATGIAPTNDLESAIVRTLNPGGYTAVLRGSGDATGIGLVEVYDLDQAANSELGNIATRGFVDAGDNVMIGGFIAGGGGGGAVKVLVRAIGPTLTNAGIAGALQNPTLELRDVNGALIAANDDWKQTQQAEVEATSIPPNDDRESAILAMLNAGNYTAIMRGSGNTTGVGLVEVYNLQ